MKWATYLGVRAVAFIVIALFPSTRAAVDWRFPVGIGFAAGAYEVKDALGSLGGGSTWLYQNYDYDDEVLPACLVFHPYAEFDFGLGIGLDIGPMTLHWIVEEYDDGYDVFADRESESGLGIVLPIGASVRYTFLRAGNVSPYARLGVQYPLVNGGHLEQGMPGALGAVGVEFFRKKRVSLGVEVAYDSSEIEVEVDTHPAGSQEVKPNGLTISIFAVF
jgi:hypothetical protein